MADGLNFKRLATSLTVYMTTASFPPWSAGWTNMATARAITEWGIEAGEEYRGAGPDRIGQPRGQPAAWVREKNEQYSRPVSGLSGQNSSINFRARVPGKQLIVPLN